MQSKACTKCGEDKPLESFPKRANSPDGRRNECSVCRKTYQREHYERTNQKMVVRQRRHERAFGLTPQAFTALAEAQGFKCAICTDTLNLEHKTFAVDHNHDTNEVRGLLCMGCNTGIGGLKDNPAILRKAADYLDAKGFYG